MPGRYQRQPEIDEVEALQQQSELERLERYVEHWKTHPVDFVCEVLNAQPDPWQCDVMDTLLVEDNVALRACHGVGKTALLSWVILWYTFTHKNAIVPTTAPTYNKQVRDVLWGTGVHKWFEQAQQTLPLLAGYFELTQTRMQHIEHPATWFSVGIASGQPINVEGYHADHLLAVFDEAKGIARPTWESIHGMRTTQEAKFLIASTPGGKTGEFFKVFTEYRDTWKSLFIIHPESLRGILRRPAARPHSRGGTYYSDRVRSKWITERGLEWGTDSAVYKARCIGDFPDLADMTLIPYEWLALARLRKNGMSGERWVSCDVARYGRDRTVFLVGEGGTLLYGETVARIPEESSSIEVKTVGIGDDKKRPLYRSTVTTAEICRRLRREYNATGIIVDDVGLGGGVSDYLKSQGEPVTPINFGSAPTDRPKDADARRAKQDKNLIDSFYQNLKAQMGWALRGGFEMNAIGLAMLPKHMQDPLIEQCSLVELDTDGSGRMKIIDPDEQEELPGVSEEGKKSPDHFHSLLLLWWAASGFGKRIRPRSGPINLPSNVAQLGQPPDRVQIGGRAEFTQTARRVGGQAAWVATAYPGRRKIVP